MRAALLQRARRTFEHAIHSLHDLQHLSHQFKTRPIAPMPQMICSASGPASRKQEMSG